MSKPKEIEKKSIWQKLWDKEFTESINMYNVLPINVEELHELMATNPLDKTKTTTIEELLKENYRIVRIPDGPAICPHCGYNCSDWVDKLEESEKDHNKVVRLTNFLPAYDPYSGASGTRWTQNFTCPKCGHKWKEGNSSI